MRLVKVDQLTGSEILARSITTSDYKEILAEGTLLKLAYIPRLEEIGIKTQEILVVQDIHCILKLQLL